MKALCLLFVLMLGMEVLAAEPLVPQHNSVFERSRDRRESRRHRRAARLAPAPISKPKALTIEDYAMAADGQQFILSPPVMSFRPRP